MSKVLPSGDSAAPQAARRNVPILRRLWRAVPVTMRRRIYKATNWTGVPAVVRFAVSYRLFHAADRFAGELPGLVQAYETANAAERREIARRFDAIADAIILPNGVRKTTYADRLEDLLAQVLEDAECELPHRAIAVLDIPASTGASSLGARAFLARRRPIARYVLGDLVFHLQYDRARDCIFDAAGTLLQVRRGSSFQSVHLPYATGSEFTALTRFVLAPLSWRGARLRDRFKAADAAHLERVPLVHPDVLAPGIEAGFIVQEMDVFAAVPGTYDLILSFNLLQRNYFSAATIERGTANLGGVLTEGGMLIVGSPDEDGLNPHRVYRKRAGRLELIRSRGEL